MSKKVCLSPSWQPNNEYAYGNTNESAECGKIAKATEKALIRCGIEVLVAHEYTLAQKCAMSDKFNADLHIPIHTNAFDGKVSGTRIFCYQFGANGHKACKAIFNALAPITPGTSESIKESPKLYEIRVPKAPTAYIEVDFHDNPTAAKWIIENTELIGETIAKGICDYFSIAYKPAEAPTQDEQKKDDKVIYRVQVGAFRNREYAEEMEKKLKNAGFDTYIVKSAT